MQILDFQEVSDFLTVVRYPICVVKQAPVCVCTVLSSGSEKWLLRCDRNLWDNQNLRFTSSFSKGQISHKEMLPACGYKVKKRGCHHVT